MEAPKLQPENERIREPQFEVRISNESQSEDNSTLNITYGHIGFEADVDLVAREFLSPLRLMTGSHDESPERLEHYKTVATKQAAEFMFENMMEDFA